MEMQHSPIAIPPPLLPPDLIASALSLPLSKISEKHRGRKIRVTGQILAFNPSSSLLLLSAPSTKSHPTPIPTLLVSTSIPLLGPSPAVQDLSAYTTNLFFAIPMPETKTSTGKWVNRQKLRFERGEYICVVGWLEGDGKNIVRRVTAGANYAPPIPIILEAIHISPSREPRSGGLCRGEIAAWVGSISVTNGHEDEDLVDFLDRHQMPRA